VKASEARNSEAVTLRTTSAPPVLSQDFSRYSIEFFLTSYILVPKPKESSQSFLDCIYPIWLNSTYSSPLVPAILAVGSCLLEAWSQLKPDGPFAFSRKQYDTAVASLRKALEKTEIVTDDVLAAVLLLDMYENLRGFFWSRPNSNAHGSGIVAMIQRRRTLPIIGETSQSLLLGARKHIAGRALTTVQGLPPTATLSLPADFATIRNLTPMVPNSPSRELDELDVQLAVLKSMVADLMSTPAIHSPIIDTISASGSPASSHDDATDMDHNFAISLLEQCYALSTRFETWYATLPPLWQVTSVSSPSEVPASVASCGLYGSACHVYTSIYIAHSLNAYRASFIKLHLSILSLLTYLGASNTSAAVLASEDRIQQLTDDLCASVPFHLGDRVGFVRIDDKRVQYPHLEGVPVPQEHYVGAAAMAGWSLAMRLGEIMGLPVRLRQGQKMWVLGQLKRIAGMYGVQAGG
jgi:hypothetical protein